MVKKTATHRLDDVRAALATATKQITDLETQRNAALLKDDDELAVKLFGELETLRAVARGHTDKIALLEAEAQRENAARIVREHQSLIGRFEKKLDDSDTDLTDGTDLIAQGWKKIESGISKREQARAAFNVHSSHARGSAEAPDGCAMAGAAIVHLLSHEFYRISARPLLGGRQGERARPHLPGAKPPRLELQLQPEKITPFSEKVRTASKFAVDLLRAEIGQGGNFETLPPDTATERTPAEIKLSGLLKRMAELADASITDPAAEAEYHAIGPQIATAQSEVDAERGQRT